jgi:hypothetical protein
VNGSWPDEPAPAGPPQKRRPRWGLRTLGFLGLAFLALATAVSQGYHTVGTLGSLLFGLIGAGYCSVKGVRDALDHGEIDTFLGFLGRRGR